MHALEVAQVVTRRDAEARSGLAIQVSFDELLDRAGQPRGGPIRGQGRQLPRCTSRQPSAVNLAGAPWPNREQQPCQAQVQSQTQTTRAIGASDLIVIATHALLTEGDELLRPSPNELVHS